MQSDRNNQLDNPLDEEQPNSLSVCKQLLFEKPFLGNPNLSTLLKEVENRILEKTTNSSSKQKNTSNQDLAATIVRTYYKTCK